MELEENSCILFLDTKIYRTDQGFKFDIYRKLTRKPSFINFFSNHSIDAKKSAIFGMFLRALNVCSPEYLENEIKKIYDIFQNLCYSKSLIDSSFSNAKNKFYRTLDKEPFDCKYMLKLTFHQGFILVKHF